MESTSPMEEYPHGVIAWTIVRKRIG
jgi:hypothetical protein